MDVYQESAAQTQQRQWHEQQMLEEEKAAEIEEDADKSWAGEYLTEGEEEKEAEIEEDQEVDHLENNSLYGEEAETKQKETHEHEENGDSEQYEDAHQKFASPGPKVPDEHIELQFVEPEIQMATFPGQVKHSSQSSSENSVYDYGSQSNTETNSIEQGAGPVPFDPYLAWDANYRRELVQMGVDLNTYDPSKDDPRYDMRGNEVLEANEYYDVNTGGDDARPEGHNAVRPAEIELDVRPGDTGPGGDVRPGGNGDDAGANGDVRPGGNGDTRPEDDGEFVVNYDFSVVHWEGLDGQKYQISTQPG